MSNEILFERKNDLTTKIKLYATREFISNDILFGKKIKNLTTKCSFLNANKSK